MIGPLSVMGLNGDCMRRCCGPPRVRGSRALKTVPEGCVSACVRRAIDLAGDYTIWQDFPDEPGQVYSYIGKCERYIFTSPQIRFFVDEEMQKRWVLSGAACTH